MLIRGKDVIGLKVISLKKGKTIEDVDDLIYEPKENRVRALLVDKGGWFSDAKVILYEDIKKIGKDAVIVESSDVLRRAGEIGNRVETIARANTYLTKTKIMTEDGTELGKVSDIFFDDTSGRVEELEVGRGKIVKVADIITIGEDATIVKSYTEEELKKQTMSYKASKTIREEKEKAQKGVEDLKGKAEVKKDEIGARVRAGVDDLKKTVQDMMGTAREQRVRFAVGQYLTKNILDKRDQVIGKRGDMVTNDLIKRAEMDGVLDQVLDNVSEEPV